MNGNSRLAAWRSCASAVVLVALCAGAQADPQAIRAYEDAVSRFNSGDTKGALIQLKNSLKSDPSQLPARVLMGRIQLDLHNPQQAEEELLAAGKLGADRALIALPLAQARNRQGKYNEVIASLRPPEYPVGIQADLWAELGKARLGNRDRVGAEIAFNEALKLVPYHVEATLNQARDLIERNMFDQAAPLVTSMLSRAPDDAEALFLMGSIEQGRGQFESALNRYRQAQQIDPDHLRAALGEALVLLDWGKKESGLVVLEKIIAARPSSLEANYFYAKTLSELGRENEAREIVRRASDVVNKVAPADLKGNPGQLFLASLVTFENGQFESAHRFLTTYLEIEPGDLTANKLLARLLVKINQPSEALRLLTRLKLSYPEDPELLVMLGDANSNLHDYLGAERYYRAALQQVEGDSRLIERLGLSQLKQGETGVAIGTFERLVGNNAADNVGAALFLGLLYLSDGRLDEARDLAVQVVGVEPQNLVARNLQAAIEISAGKHELGRQMLEETLKLDPAFRPARINLVRLDVLEGNYTAARDVVEELLRSDPNNEQALRESAQIAAALGDRRAAIAQFERIREINPKAVRPQLELMDLYLAEGQSSEALKVALALNQAVPDSLLAKKALARVQLLRGETVMAQSLLDDAAKLARYDANQLAQVAGLQVRAGALESAEETLRKALELRPESVVARLEMASLLAGQRHYAEAATHALEARRHDPKSVAAAGLLGEIRLAQGRLPEAVELYREALGIDERPELMVRLHNVLVMQGKADLALVELREWNERHPDKPTTMIVLADHLQQAGDTDGALQIYRRLAELAPQSFLVQNNLANLLMPVDAEQALVAALRAHELAPDNADVLDTLGWMYVQLGELDRGLSYLRQAVTRDSRSPVIRYHLAVALEEYGNKTEARRELQRALQIGVPFDERERALQRLQRLEGQ